MKKKLLILGAVVSMGGLGFAAESDSKMPQGGGKCIPGESGTCKPIEQVNDTQNRVPKAKKLQMNSVQVYKGTVSSVVQDRYPNGVVHLQIVLDTDKGEETILVGPASYVTHSKVSFEVGDKIEVRGYPVGANGDKAVMAKSIKLKNGQVLQLLDDQRQPLWRRS